MDENQIAILIREAVQKLDEQRIALTTQELVDKLGIGRSTYFKLRAIGKMPPSITVGRRRLTTIFALNRWLRQLEEQSAASQPLESSGSNASPLRNDRNPTKGANQ